jgi:hypothetical protein
MEPDLKDSAKRMRLYRERRAEGLRCVPLEVRDREVDALIACGLLSPDQAKDREAIASAIGSLLDIIPASTWPAWIERSKQVTAA